MTPVSNGPIVLVNNSLETFTPTVSGAIGTCLWELCQVAEEGGDPPVVVTRSIDADPYPWPATRFVRPWTEPSAAVVSKALRVARRLTGWASMGQRAYAREVAVALGELRPAVVLCNNDPELAVYLRSKFPDVRIVHWFHNLLRPADGFRRKYRADGGLVSVAVSGYLARAVEAAYELEPLSVPVARNGVDSQRYRPSERAADDGAGLPVLGFVGRICVEKAPDTFLRACLALSDTRKDFTVQLVGDTNWGRSEPTEIRSVVDGLAADLSDRGVEVRRPGHVARADVPAAIRRSDVHVVPSRWDEPCALTVLEGLATGVAVVASATGGSPELVGDAGLLFPRDDVAGLAQVLCRLLDDPGARRRLGVRARARAVTFTWSHTWDALVSPGWEAADVLAHPRTRRPDGPALVADLESPRPQARMGERKVTWTP